MKKFLSLFAVAAVAALGFTSCSDDDDDPQYDVISSSNGVYVLNAGNQGAGIDGSITYLDNNSSAVSQKVYQTVNGKSLGRTVNDAVTYGSKIYIIGSGEKTIFVANRTSMKEITTIKSEMPDTEGGNVVATPRHAVAYRGHVYVSTYNNKVLDIDTLSLKVVRILDCGNYSEGMTVQDGYLYTADSDYSHAVGNASISKINLATGKTEIIKNENIVNAVDIKSYNGRLFYLDSGSYDENWNQSGQGVYELLADGTSKKLFSATGMTMANGKIFSYDAPYTNPATTPTFSVYDIAAGESKTFIDGTDIANPCAIAVDAKTNRVYITSNNLVDGIANYMIDGYCMVYDLNGVKLNKFTTGVGPSAISFNYDFK